MPFPYTFPFDFEDEWGSEDLFGEFEIRQTATPQDLFAEFEVGQSSEDLFAKKIIRHSASKGLFAETDIVQWKDLKAIFEVGQGSKEFKAIFRCGSGENYLPGWMYRKRHSLVGSSAGTQTDYQIKIVAHHGAGADGGDDVYCNGKCKADFGDIRFTDVDGSTLLDYWMEKKTDSNEATFWVKVPKIPKDPAITCIYVYYGNNASTTSSGDDTFEIFNDCDDAGDWAVDWSNKSPSWGITTIDGVNALYITINEHQEGLRLQYETQVNTGRENRRFRLRVKHTSWNSDGYSLFWPSRRATAPTISDYIYYSSYYDYYRVYCHFNGVTKYTWLGAAHPNGWYDYELLVNVAGNVIGYRNGTSLGGYTGAVDGDAAGGKVTFQSQEYNAGLTQYYVDWFFIGKYVSPEPAHDAWGPEEQYAADLYAKFEAQATKNLFAKLDVTHWKDLKVTFDVGQDSEDLFSEFMLRRVGDEDLFAKGIIRHSDSLDQFAELIVRHSATKDIFSKFLLRQDTEDLLAKLVSRHSSSEELKAVFRCGSGENYLPGWMYRKRHAVTGSSADLVEDYQIGIKVYYGAGADGDEAVNDYTFGKVYCNGKCKADFGDIRFTDVDGSTLLDHWLWEKVDGSYALFWVKVPQIPKDPASTRIYVYYGGSATSASDGDNTFIFFDDFTYNRGWTIGNPTYIQFIPAEECLWIDYRRPAASMYCYRSVPSFPSNFEFRIDSWYDITLGANDWSTGYFAFSKNNNVSRHGEDDIYGLMVWGEDSPSKHGYAYWTGSVGRIYTDADADPNSSRFIYRIRKYSTDLEYYCESDNVADGSEAVSEGIPSITYLKAWMPNSQEGDENDDCRRKIYLLWVRNWIDPEPVNGVWGPQEQYAADIYASFEAQATKNLFAEFAVRQSGYRDLKVTFRLPQEILPAEFIVRQTATLDLFSEATLRHSASKDVFSKFLAAHTGSEDLFAKTTIRQSTSKDLFAEANIVHWKDLKAIFEIGQGSEELFAEFMPRRSTTFDIFAKTIIRQSDALDQFAKFIVRHSSIEDIFAEFILRKESAEDLFDEFLVRQSDAASLFCNFIIRQIETADLFAEFMVGVLFEDLLAKLAVRHSASRNVFAEFEIQAFAELFAKFRLLDAGSEALYSKFIVRNTGFQDLSAESIIRHSTSQSLFAEFMIRRTGTAEAFSKFVARQIASRDLSSKLIVRQSTSEELFAELITRHSAITELFNKVIIQHSATRDLLAEFISRHEDYQELFSSFILRKPEARDLFSKLEVRKSSFRDLTSKFIVSNRGISELLTEFTVRQLSITDLFAEFVTRIKDFKELPAKFTIQHIDVEDLVAEFIVRGRAERELKSEGIIRHPAAQDLRSRFEVGQNSANLISVFWARHPLKTDLLSELFIRQLETKADELFILRRGARMNIGRRR